MIKNIMKTKREFIKLLREKNTNQYIKWIIFTIVVIFLWLFIYCNKCYIKFTKEGVIDKERLFYASAVICMAVATIIIAFVRMKFSDKVNKFLSYMLFLFSPIICYFTLELFHRKKYGIDVTSIPNFYRLLNFIILFVILLFFLVITNRIKLSVIILSILTSLFGVANYYVYNFRGVALVASDIYSASTAASVAGDYKLFVDRNIYFIFIATLFFITITCKLRSFPVIKNLRVRVVTVLSYTILFGGFINIFILSDQLNDWNINIKLYRPHESYRKYGSVLAMVRTIGYIVVDKPEGYSVKVIEEIESRYSEDKGEGQTPNVIVIMDEAFSDIQSINQFKMSEDNMPFIRSLEENTIKGNAYVSVFGGNTANTEFEFLTGNSMALLPANTVPYQLYIKDEFPSIIYSFKQQNYKGNLAIHPYKANGFNRASVYPLLGFEEFIAIDGFNQDKKLRGKVTDEADFEKIIEEYNKVKSKSNQPFFLFNVTMQNHGGYSVNDPNFIQKILIEDEKYNNEFAQNYLSLIKYTDEAVAKLIGYFENIEEPTVIIFFGDHRPGLDQAWYDKLFGKSEDKLSSEVLMLKYQVPFFVWANYDIPEENIDKISMNYLSAYIMNRIGLNLTKYQQYILDVYEQIPAMNTVGYWGADGNFYNYNDTQSPYYNVICEYKNVQYNNMFDKGNRVKSMFYPN